MPDAPFMDPAHFISVLIGTMVDLYLVTSDQSALDEIKAHLALTVEQVAASAHEPAQPPRRFG